MAKKSLYLFLTGLLGVMLFLVLHRAVVFFYLYMLAGGYITTSWDYSMFLAADYFSLVLVLMLGAWYGIWLGLYWYEKVYEQQTHRGMIHHLAVKYFPGPQPKNAAGNLEALKQRLENDFLQLENLSLTTAASPSPTPQVRRLTRKKAPKKLNKLA